MKSHPLFSTICIGLTIGVAAFAGQKQSDPMTDGFDVNIAKQIGDLFGQVMMQHQKNYGPKYPRPVFLKPHGCAKATFTIPADLPAPYQKGLFKTPGAHSAWVRLSSDTVPSTPDMQNNTIGLAIKVLDVPGKKVLAGEENFTTQDFLLQNHNVFFSDTAKDFLEAMQSIFNGKFNQYLKDHPVTGKILDDMAKPVDNVLSSNYWSTTPYKFDTAYAKYKAVPCQVPSPEKVSSQPNYLRDRLARDLKAKEACFHLQVQLRKDETMPLDKATVEWSETASVPQTVATIRMPVQDIDAVNDECEDMSFTAWHALPEHTPVGSINQARGFVYKRMADLRRTKNGVPIAEPKE